MSKWGHQPHGASSVTLAVIEAVDTALRQTRPADRYSTAIVGLLGAILAIIVRARGDTAPADLPRIATRVAEDLIAASRLLARTLARDHSTRPH